jgi:hypothetical protein
MRTLFLVVVLAVLAAGCSMPFAGDPIVDGLRVGPPAPCGTCDQPTEGTDCGSCDSVAAVGRAGLALRWPGATPIVDLSVHREGCPPTSDGSRCLVARSGTLWVVVGRYGDDTEHAVPVYCGVGGCRFAAEYSP